ncbi:MAG TPA: alpha-amylase family glycosyl hydrolase [Geobacteraceae bacterium]
MKKSAHVYPYFPCNVPISGAMWERLRLELPPIEAPEIVFIRRVADSLNRLPERSGRTVRAGLINLYGLQARILRYLVDQYAAGQKPGALEAAARNAGFPYASPDTLAVLARFGEIFPGAEVLAGAASPAGFVNGADPAGRKKNGLVRELLLLFLARENRALDPFRELLDHGELSPDAPCGRIAAAIDRALSAFDPFAPYGMTLPRLLRAPFRAAPDSLPGQMAYIRDNWRDILPPELLEELLTSLDIAAEEEREWFGGPGSPEVLEFLKRGPGAHDYPEYERFSPDAGWMANVVMMAKMTYVWLDQLSKQYARPIRRLDQVPDEELDCLARWGFTGLWLIGLWERSPASQRIKQISGNPEAASSAYSLYDYAIAHDLGGDAALANLRERAGRRGIRLASDMVPNHTGIYSRWTVEHPDWFVQLDYPPYPDYSFTGPDLSSSPEVSLVIEDGYWDRRNAAVVFKHYDHRDGRTRYIYHGNDGTSTPWNDTAQLNYLVPEVREAVVQTILHVARQFPIIRFDAAMTLAKKHYQRLWYPQPGHGSGVPSRAGHGMTRQEFDAAFPEEFWREVVDRVAAEVPDTLLLAEAFWLMEGYFVRTLGMHRVYNSAFMNMLKMEENAKYRQTIKNVLEYDHRILQRFVNFMNNPDERTAVEQFGKEGKYFGAAVLLVTMPGLPMFGHGQIEGLREKYGMEYTRACWDEQVDSHMVRLHEERIFPLMRRRRLFSGSADFVLYDFYAESGVNEDVFAYSNRAGDERGLVLFHNRFADTAGWIRTSAAMAEKDDRGETRLVRKTLGEALGFNPDGRCYYAFRDYASGLEYLRSGRELCEQGLFADLGGYDCRAFLDFREIMDDDFGSWGTLCHRLQGGPVASLAEEVKGVRHGAVIDLFRGVATEVALLLAASGADESELERLAPLVAGLYEEINRHTACAGDSRALAVETLREVAGAFRLRSLAEEKEETAEAAADRLLLAAYFVLHGTGKLAGAEDHPPVAAAWFTELGLGRAFGELVRETPQGMETEEAALLLRLMLRWQLLFRGWQRKSAWERLTLLFADQNARAFLGVHTYQESEWFVKERFELLLERLTVAEEVRLGGTTADEDTLRSAVTLLRKELHYLLALADGAGYRVERFLGFLRDTVVARDAKEDP